VSAKVVVRGLSWRPLGRRGPVLLGIDLCLQPGERVLLTGPSGSGKSTLLLALADQLSGEDGELAGSVVVDGTVGLLLQDPTSAVVAEHVGRDVAFGPENLAVPRSDIWPAVADALHVSHFPYGADRRTSELSGGESARLALAGAMALHPGLLLLDEPLAMLDGPTADQVRTAILAAAAGCTLVVVDHRTGPWLPHVDRVVQLSSSGTLVTTRPQAHPRPALTPPTSPPTALSPQSAAKRPLTTALCGESASGGSILAPRPATNRTFARRCA
jgi:energy-coupling factor transport system ATP-binding protein